MQFLALLITVVWLFLYMPVLLAVFACGLVLLFLGALALNLMGMT